MADKRGKDLDSQSTRLADLLIPCDKASGFTEMKQIASTLLSPLISEESNKASLTSAERGSYLMRVNDSAGNEYNIVIEDLFIYESWVQPSLNTNFTHVSGNELKYRRIANNQLQIKGGFTTSVASVLTPFTLPADYRPSENRFKVIVRSNAAFDDGGDLEIVIKTDGTIIPIPAQWSNTLRHYIDITIPLD